MGSTPEVSTTGSNAAHSSFGGPSGSGVRWITRPAASDRHLHDFGGSAASSWRKAVPNGDQDIAVRNRRPPNHDISLDVFGALAWKFEHTGGSREKIVEALARPLIGEAGTIFCSPKWQNGLQLHPNDSAASAAIWSDPSAMADMKRSAG